MALKANRRNGRNRARSCVTAGRGGLHHANVNYILTAEAARLIGVTPNSVRIMERRGELPAERVGSVRLFDRTVVERLARARAQRQRSARAEGRLAG
jgi:excisionase family DNA binding protein